MGKVVDWTHHDTNMAKLIEVIQNGFPATCYELSKDIREYFQFRNELHMVDGAICYKDRIVIPEYMRIYVCDSAHAAHQGVTGMVSRLNCSVFWPRIHSDIMKKYSHI